MFPEFPPEAWAALEARQGNPDLWPMLVWCADGTWAVKLELDDDNSVERYDDEMSRDDR